VTMHGVRGALLRAQAAAAGVPLVEIAIPGPCPDHVYAARMAQALARPPLADVDEIAFGDLFLADIRAYREARLAEAGRRAVFPLWGRDTAALAHEFVGAGFEAVLVCVDGAQLDPAFAGRAYDRALLADLPAHVDPCGERGEFHTFVHAGPVFARRIPVERGAIATRDGLGRCDLLPEGVGAPDPG
jgi:uncharacterized protein (TIGR00290 family)